MATDINPTPALTRDVVDVQTTSCCIVGGGPAGAVLGLLLARQGIPAMLLETHKDLDRDFRGDTIHPSVMEIMAEIGLSDRLLQLPHAKMHDISIETADDKITLAEFSHLKTRYPYITMLPQVKFLEFIVSEAQKYPNFQLVMGANVQELIEEDGAIKGIRYRGNGGWHEVRAILTVGADGRHSHTRQLGEFTSIPTSPPMDVLWFRLPRLPKDPSGGRVKIAKGRILACLERPNDWQIGYVIPKGKYQELRIAGLAALRQAIAEVMPDFQNRLEQLHDWSQVAFLSVESDRLKRWYRPGLLLIGDAAHIMSPVAGVGINYAIQDAVVAANILTHPLKTGKIELKHLAQVQQQRELPTKIIQAFQAIIQKQIFSRALNLQQTFKPPAWLRLPIVRDIPARLIAFGVFPVHLKTQTQSYQQLT